MALYEATSWAADRPRAGAPVAPGEAGQAVLVAQQVALVFVAGEPEVAVAAEVAAVAEVALAPEAPPSFAELEESWEEAWHGWSVWRKEYEVEREWARVEERGRMPKQWGSVEEASSRVEAPWGHSAAASREVTGSRARVDRLESWASPWRRSDTGTECGSKGHRTGSYTHCGASAGLWAGG